MKKKHLKRALADAENQIQFWREARDHVVTESADERRKLVDQLQQAKLAGDVRARALIADAAALVSRFSPRTEMVVTLLKRLEEF